MNEEIYEGTSSPEDVLIGVDSGYNRYRRPDGSTYVHYPYSRMATVTAYSAKDKKGQPICTADGKLITGKTQAEADRNRFRYDMNHWVEANRRKTAHLPKGWREKIVTPDMNTFNAITGGVFNLTPIQVGRGIYNLSQGEDPGFILGNSGVVSKEYAQEHPWLALGTNVLGEGLTGGFIYGAPKLYNNIKSIHKHLNTPYKNISINGQALSNTQIEILNLSKQLLINKGIKHPTLAQIINNSNLGFTVPENFYSGVSATLPLIKTFNGNIWLSDNKDVYTYFSNRNYPGSNNITNRFLAGYPSKAEVYEVDFKNNGFRGELDSDEVVRHAVENNFDVIKQNNIVELTSPGTNIIIPKGTDRLIISKNPKFKYLDWDWLKFNYLTR